MAVDIETIVINFGDGSVVTDGSASLIVDQEQIEDIYGEDKNSFQPGDNIWFIAHIDSNLRIVSCQCSGGDIISRGYVDRVEETEGSFVAITTPDVATGFELSYVPVGGITTSFYDNVATYTLVGKLIEVTGGELPAIAAITYNTRPTQYELVPPSITLVDDDDSHPILIVLFVEEIEDD